MKLYGCWKELVMPDLMRIGELAAAAGVSNRTVDFYTNLGLIQPADRSAGGFRLYDPSAVELIATIRRLEASGMALDDIARDMSASGAAEFTEVIARLNHDLESLRGLAEAAGSNMHGIITTLAMRAHHLITTATELLNSMQQQL